MAFIDELEKRLFIKKNCWSGPIKKCKTFNIYNVFFWKNKRKHLELSLFYTCVPKILMIWFTVLEIIVWQTKIGSYESFFALLPPKTPKNQNFAKNEKRCWRYHLFTHAYQKPQSYEVWFLSYGVKPTKIFSFWAIFHPFTSLMALKIIICIKCKKRPQILSFVYHEWRSYDVCSLRYKVWGTNDIKKMRKTPGNIILHLCTTEDDYMMYGSWDIKCDNFFFVNLGYFCPFALLTTTKSKFWKNEKNAWIYLNFTQVYHKLQSYVWVLRYEAWKTEFFCSFGPSFALLPHQQPKKSKFWKNEEKNPGGVIILHMWTKNHDHILYCSWDMEHDGCNIYFSFWDIFCHFSPLTA